MVDQAQPVGRVEQRAALVAAVEDGAAGRPHVVILHGEPGIGKTTLVRELVERALDLDHHCLFGPSLRFGADVTSYVPFRTALRRWLRTVAPTVRRAAVGRLSGWSA